MTFDASSHREHAARALGLPMADVPLCDWQWMGDPGDRGPRLGYCPRIATHCWTLGILPFPVQRRPFCDEHGPMSRWGNRDPVDLPYAARWRALTSEERDEDG